MSLTIKAAAIYAIFGRRNYKQGDGNIKEKLLGLDLCSCVLAYLKLDDVDTIV